MAESLPPTSPSTVFQYTDVPSPSVLSTTKPQYTDVHSPGVLSTPKPQYIDVPSLSVLSTSKPQYTDVPSPSVLRTPKPQHIDVPSTSVLSTPKPPTSAVSPLSPRVLSLSPRGKDKFSWLPGSKSAQLPSPRWDDLELADILSEDLSLQTTPQSKFEVGEDDFSIEEGETQEHLDPKSLNDPGVSELIETLLSWLNHELASDRVSLTNINTDLRDGQVFALIHEKIMGCGKLETPCGHYVQSRERQKKNLDFVIEQINKSLALAEEQIKWKTSLLFYGEELNTLRLLIKINKFCLNNSRPAPDLPRVLKVNILRIKKVETGVQCEKRVLNIMEEESVIGRRDGFDTLIDHAPQKLNLVQNSMINFVNSYLSPIGKEVEKLEEFSDGVKLLMLIGALQGFFIPFYEYKQNPESKEDMIENVNLAFRFIQEDGLPPPLNRPGEVVRGDLKAIIRIIYSLFVKYKQPPK